MLACYSRRLSIQPWRHDQETFSFVERKKDVEKKVIQDDGQGVGFSQNVSWTKHNFGKRLNIIVDYYY